MIRLASIFLVALSGPVACSSNRVQLGEGVSEQLASSLLTKISEEAVEFRFGDSRGFENADFSRPIGVWVNHKRPNRYSVRYGCVFEEERKPASHCMVVIVITDQGHGIMVESISVLPLKVRVLANKKLQLTAYGGS